MAAIFYITITAAVLPIAAFIADALVRIEIQLDL